VSAVSAGGETTKNEGIMGNLQIISNNNEGGGGGEREKKGNP